MNVSILHTKNTEILKKHKEKWVIDVVAELKLYWSDFDLLAMCNFLADFYSFRLYFLFHYIRKWIDFLFQCSTVLRFFFIIDCQNYRNIFVFFLFVISMSIYRYQKANKRHLMLLSTNSDWRNQDRWSHKKIP